MGKLFIWTPILFLKLIDQGIDPVTKQLLLKCPQVEGGKG